MNRYLGEKCKNHPLLDADDRCATCWGYFCDACLEDIGEHRYCGECAPVALEKYNAARQAATEERKRLDLRLLLYVLIALLAVIIGGGTIYFNGGFDQFLGSYMPSYQVSTSPKTLGSKLNDFKIAKSEHFDIYYHSADIADNVNRLAEDYFNRILADLLIFEKDVMSRGKFNIVIAKDNDELKNIFPDVLTGRAAMTDYETKTIIIVEANEAGNIQTDLSHEITHAIFFERMNSGNHIPAWIHEGISSYEEAKIDPTQTGARWATFGPDISGGGGLPLKDLAIKAEAGPEEVNLFYAESYSVVKYLIDTRGMLKFMKLSTSLQSGKNIDAAIKTVYDPDLTSLSNLEVKWRTSLN